MPTLNLLCAPAGSGKTRRLLDRCRQAALGQALWIGPDSYALDAIRHGLSAGQAGLCLPRLLTFQEFADAIIRRNDSAARPIGDSQKRLLGDRLIRELSQAGELSHFEAVLETRGFTEGVFAFLSELKSAEIWPGQLARAAYRRGYQGRDQGRQIGRQAVRRKDRQLARLYARYQRQLLRHNLFDSEGRLWHARDLLARGGRAPFEAIRRVFLDGFVHLTRTQVEIVQALAGWVDEICIALPDEAGDDRAELFARSRLTRQRLAVCGFSVVSWGDPASATPPAAISHIERQLFRPLRAITPADHAAGLLLIQAPGQLGEARLVARQIKSLLLSGVGANDIVVALRDLEAYADLLEEVFTEYGIPLALAGAAPLIKNPAVATLLRAWRLVEGGWPFAGVTALLRSTYLRPDWPEAAAELPAQAEALLRMLGEPAGRDAYLAGVQRWIDNPPPLLEDEEGYPRRRQMLQELAQRSRAFLVRFFQAWDGQPTRAPAAEHLAWLRQLMTDLGIDRAASDEDRAALALLFEEVPLADDAAPLDRQAFGRRLALRSQSAGLPRLAGLGRVRVLAAEQACNVEVAHLFIMGLGEGGFPDLSAPDPMLDEAERRSFQRAGLDLPPLRDRLSEEMLLFYRLATRARARLVLTYPAVDDQGQDLLPSSFLTALLDCFQPGAVETIRRRLQIEGYADDVPLSPVELRVQWAGARRFAPAPGGSLHEDLLANLDAAAELADLRLRQPRHSEYDGLLHQAGIQAELGQLFGAERTFSPTALEDYVACPFRFLLKHVLRLEPLEEPRAEIVQTGRGLVVHRALARLHRQLNEAGTRPDDELVAALRDRLAEAVREQIAVAASPAARELWRLEGIRLERWFRRYPGHWEKFLGPWRERSIAPRPHAFEVPFGHDGVAPLVISEDGVTVRIGGRIDRVDLAEIEDQLGYWIIDYKTGSAQYYRGHDLDQLQLPIYALAVEEVVLAGQAARPLGLAYWMVTGSGVKLSLPAKPADWLADGGRWPRFRDQLKAWIATLATHIRRGDFPLQPRQDESCDTCDFGQVCRISQSRSAMANKDWELPLPVVDG